MPKQIVVTLPEEATDADTRAVEALLRKALPQAPVLVTFMGGGMSFDQQQRVRSLLPRARVSVAPVLPPSAA